jgi:bifunctional enzyme CysN/CysC
MAAATDAETHRRAPGGAAARSGSHDDVAAGGRDQLRILTCGSVDDGKSTLIGRLMYDAGLVPADQLAQLARDSRFRPTGPEGLDFSLLVDGLEAEREQGITIDVAHRFFATPRRVFIVLDAPGHEQYTANMVTGASTADIALVLVDAAKDIVTQTIRHTLLAGLFGIRDAILVVNKMDTVGWSRATFRRIRSTFERIASQAGITRVSAVATSALYGDNVVRPSPHTADWSAGLPLLARLETIEASALRRDPEGAFRMPVQWVNRARHDFRGYAGSIVQGTVRTGDLVVVAETGTTAQVSAILGTAGDCASAREGEAVTVRLDRDIEVSRGNVLAAAQAPPAVADAFQVHLVWLDDAPMLPGRSYLMRIGTMQTTASISTLKHRIDPDSFAELAARQLVRNDIAVANLTTTQPIAFEPYATNRMLGGFILIDRLSCATVAAGLIDTALNGARSLHVPTFDLMPAARAALKGQRPAILWFTGLSGAGKTTIANLVDGTLVRAGRHTYVLDGDDLRHGLNRDLGFTAADRVENIRRTAHVARMMADAGLIVLVSLISPFRRERVLAREIAGEIAFLEIFVDAPLAVCEARDPKGLYRKARAGQLANFTGIDSDYEPPLHPDLHLDTADADAESARGAVLSLLESHGLL